MDDVLKDAKQRMDKSYESFESHIATVRTGRANPAVLDRVSVDYYGASMPLNQIASISSPDPRTLVITPFDKSAIGEIERAIRESDLGSTRTTRGMLCSSPYRHSTMNAGVNSSRPSKPWVKRPRSPCATFAATPTTS